MITKQIAGLLYGFNYQLQDNEGNVYWIEGVENCPYDNDEVTLELMGQKLQRITNKEIGSTYKILAREMDLTKPIEGVGVPIVELAKIAEFNFENSYEVAEVKNAIIFRTYFGYRDFAFLDGNFGSSDYDSSLKSICQWKVKNQLALFNWLYTHHFNLDFPEGTTTNLI